MAKPTFEEFDRQQLRSYGADTTSPKLQEKYRAYRDAWDRDYQVGKMDRATLMFLAVEYGQTEPEKEAKRGPGRPKKEMAIA